MTKYIGKAEVAAQAIVDAFRSGNLPKALAPVFIRRNDNMPCRRWSWSNQLLAALMGHDDARGYRQWEAVGRHVKKGEKSFPILAPLTRKYERQADDGTTEEGAYCYGFKTVPVFGLSQTEGKPLPGDVEAQQFIDSLPVIEVARAWRISVQLFDGEGASCLGKYRADGHIALGVRNRSTWAHELIHAADHRNVGTLKSGQHLDQETVAELGGAALLEALGLESDADRGRAWAYILAYCSRENVDPITICCQLLNRVCAAVALVLATADELAGQQAPELAAA
jgi:antirestriction protein ArdC